MKELVELIRDKIAGKKTYIFAVLAVIIAILQAIGVIPAELPGWVWKFLIIIGGGTGASKATIDKIKSN